LSIAAAPPVVHPAARIRGTVELPGDKSIAHRALIVGALSGGPSSVTVRAAGADVRSTAACLRSLGVTVEETGDRALTQFTIVGLPTRNATVDCSNSGTTMRLLAGALAGLPLRVTLDGDDSLRTRPMERVAVLLRTIGAEVTTTDGHAPMIVHGRRRLSAAGHHLPVASAQLLGAALLAGLAADGETTISSPGPTRDHTERLLAEVGIRVRRDGLVTTVHGPATPSPLSLIVPGDVSSAAPWLIAAALHPDAQVTLTGVGLNPTRTALFDVVRRAGAEVEATVRGVRAGEPIGDIRARGGGRLAPVTIAGTDAAALIDELPLLGVLMAATGGELRGAAELRLKESDRIAATVTGLRAIGASVEELPDGWRVTPGTPRDAAILTHGDHRIAIAFAIAAVSGVAASVELDDPASVDVSYPTFWSDLEGLAA
jgi:3-phosphoshikimate 1-carboxyvinyltransferase